MSPHPAGGAASGRARRLSLRPWAVLAVLLLAGCGSIAQPSIVSNRPNGEGYAGAGELVVRIGQMRQEGFGGLFAGGDTRRRERAYVELRYVGLDAYGRAVFRRHDVDSIAGKPDPQALEPAPTPAEGAQAEAPTLPPDTRDIVIDLRRARQIHIQGKVVEILEATSSGVVFNLY